MESAMVLERAADGISTGLEDRPAFEAGAPLRRFTGSTHIQLPSTISKPSVPDSYAPEAVRRARLVETMLVSLRKAMAEDELEGNAIFLLGKISGQMGELIHTTNNTSQKIDGLDRRITALEATENKRQGAVNLGTALLKSPPVGWIVATAATLYGLLRHP